MNNVRKYRKSKGRTLEMLAKACGTSKGNLCDIEHGKVKSPSVYLAIKIAKSLNTSVQKLFPAYELKRIEKGK